MDNLRIGILLTRVKSESKKDELVNVNSLKRPWLKLAHKYLNKNHYIVKGGKKYVAGDVSIGLYLLYTWENLEVDFILPEEITSRRLAGNHINFMIIYDIVESFHVDGIKLYTRVKNALKAADNVYPPYNYQKFINNKCEYIKHISKYGKNLVIPTYCQMNNPRAKLVKSMEIVEKMVKKNKWEKFIGKPVYGQESIDFNLFKTLNRKSLKPYMEKCFKKKKYPGIIFQKYIEGFDKSKPEIRMYFTGDKYKYSVITGGDMVKTPRCEKGTLDVPQIEALKRFARNILRKLPQIRIQGVILPKLLTRIDIACDIRFGRPWLVNEIEFVPSLYIQDIARDQIPEIHLGEQMIIIAVLLMKKSRKFEY